MKILIIQTARFGDILQTFPLLNALKRTQPDCEIHYLARERFSKVLEMNNNIDKIHLFDSKSILKPIIMAPFEPGYDDGMGQSLDMIQQLLDELKNENYNKVCNLSFSPMTSYLTHYLSDSETVGYTRHSDGFLNFAEDVSAFFYAQVGIGGQSRIHLSDLYATMLNVDYEDSDWRLHNIDNVDLSEFNLPKKYICVHISASQQEKSLSTNQWLKILKTNNDLSNFVLLGDSNEFKMSEEIASQLNCINLVGKTNIKQLAKVIQTSSGFLGADSLPMNLCSFTNTLCYNLSFNSVRFWETGPLSNKSFVRCFNKPSIIDMEIVNSDINYVFKQKGDIPGDLFYYSGNINIQRYNSQKSNYDFSWELIKAIYMEEKFPIIDDMNLYIFAEKIGRLISVITENLNFAKDSDISDSHLNIVSECEALLHKIGVSCSSFRPLINWIYTEKIKIPPGEVSTILDKTIFIYTQALDVMKIYLGEIKNESVDLVK